MSNIVYMPLGDLRYLRRDLSPIDNPTSPKMKQLQLLYSSAREVVLKKKQSWLDNEQPQPIDIIVTDDKQGKEPQAALFRADFGIMWPPQRVFLRNTRLPAFFSSVLPCSTGRGAHKKKQSRNTAFMTSSACGSKTEESYARALLGESVPLNLQVRLRRH